mmetsp:Transcript_29880/g.41294  ORF Transcript_29880/g.41294 Transcript_29880/m.41294 type:complete len:195 (+) Transcript_29880:92-676(+)|eukprot:CAMPEP_0201488846 /NCGR_PEP_ID=MMETSP0151_2-20130828/19813_1 /ASSEMBLY_ACC=CAM_ASM_000257 /TAXON_ID=200890 /ORGANISM="Paramoeba atlantica, Strain 621/1 / CCAP 1560/9" /LENGTH=194 /DNA_ID=CAMNT_0047874227 /DNA_START=88 /DNA_END=672 /DNA_ORIENTATION=+
MSYIPSYSGRDVGAVDDIPSYHGSDVGAVSVNAFPVFNAGSYDDDIPRYSGKDVGAVQPDYGDALHIKASDVRPASNPSYRNASAPSRQSATSQPQFEVVGSYRYLTSCPNCSHSMRKKARSKKSFMIAAVGVGIVGVGASVFTAGLAAIVFIPLTVGVWAGGFRAKKYAKCDSCGEMWRIKKNSSPYQSQAGR